MRLKTTHFAFRLYNLIGHFRIEIRREKRSETNLLLFNSVIYPLSYHATRFRILVSVYRLIQDHTFGQFGLQKVRYRDAVVSGQLYSLTTARKW